MRPRKRKKVDYAALQSPFMRIPQMRVDAARSLLDSGVSEIYELVGRAPDALFDDLKLRQEETPEEHRAYFRMAVYFAENDPPEQNKLNPLAWRE